MANLTRPTLSMDYVRTLEPFTNAAPAPHLTELYTPIQTIDVMDSLVTNGWQIVMAEAMQTRKPGREGIQAHMARLTRPDLIIGDQQVDLLLYNSHDGSKALTFRIGVYRFVCSNGLVTGYDVAEARMRHVGLEYNDVLDASYTVVSKAEGIASNIDTMQAIEMSPMDRYTYAIAAGELLYGENAPEPAKMLAPNRDADYKPSLWNTYNTVQENWEKGLVDGRRPISNIARKIGHNSALWTLSEAIAGIGTYAPELAEEDIQDAELVA